MANPEFANTEPLFLGKIQLGSFKPLVTTQYITLSYVEMGISIKNQKNVENVALNMRSVQKVSSYVI